MAQIGLKDTLSLLAKGYSKKDIDALAAIDEQQEAEKEAAPEPEPEKELEPDPTESLKADLEAKQKELDLLREQLKTNEAKITKLQQDNIHTDSGPAAAEARQKEQDALQAMVRSFM